MMLINKVDRGTWKKKTLLKVIVPQLFPVESHTDSTENKKQRKTFGSCWQQKKHVDFRKEA